ncbi:MAG: hypothetical protein JW807_05750 [Spirochaetes bacterium]|nr:hypothetical protein [Spirochaetota bacterium]
MKGKSQGESFDEMMTDIDLQLFGLQAGLARFVAALLAEKAGNAADIQLSISHAADDEPGAIQCARVFVDPDDELIKITDAAGATVEWDGLNIAAQYLIAHYLYTRRLSDSLYRSLS